MRGRFVNRAGPPAVVMCAMGLDLPNLSYFVRQPWFGAVRVAARQGIGLELALWCTAS